MEAQITRKPIKTVFCLTLLFLVRYIFVFGFETYSLADFSFKNSLSLILSCAMAPIFSLLTVLVFIKYFTPCSKTSAVLLVLLVADPLPLAGIKNFSNLTAGVLFMLCLLLVQHNAAKTISTIFVAVISVAAVYIAPEMLFSLLPMTVALYLAESGKASVSVKAIAVATVILSIISATASSLSLNNGSFTKRRIYGARPLDFIFDSNYVSTTLQKMFTVFIISAPVIIVTAYFSVKLISAIYKNSHGSKRYSELRAESSAEKAARKEQQRELKVKYKELHNTKATAQPGQRSEQQKKALQNEKMQSPKNTVPKKPTKKEEKSIAGKQDITLSRQYIRCLALIVCPFLICTVGRIVFGNSGAIVASFNLTPLLVLLTLKTNGDKYMQPLFDDFEQIIKNHSLAVAVAVIYLAGCTAYAINSQVSFTGGTNDLFHQITYYLI